MGEKTYIMTNESPWWHKRIMTKTTCILGIFLGNFPDFQILSSIIDSLNRYLQMNRTTCTNSRACSPNGCFLVIILKCYQVTPLIPWTTSLSWILIWMFFQWVKKIQRISEGWYMPRAKGEYFPFRVIGFVAEWNKVTPNPKILGRLGEINYH